MSIPQRPPQTDVPIHADKRSHAPHVSAPDVIVEPSEMAAASRAGLWGWMSRWLPFVAHEDVPAPRGGERPPIADAAGRTP